MNHHFSESLQIAKKTLKVNNKELASLLGVSGFTISNWIRGYQLSLSRRMVIMERIKELLRDAA